MRLDFTPLAEQDLEVIANYIADDNPGRALSFVRELREQCRRISLKPSCYRLRPDVGEQMQSCAFRSYVIYFQASLEKVLIVRVLHGARDVGAVFDSGSST